MSGQGISKTLRDMGKGGVPLARKWIQVLKEMEGAAHESQLVHIRAIKRPIKFYLLNQDLGASLK